MSSSASRSEGVGIRPFSGLQKLEGYISENVVLEVQSNAGKDQVEVGSWLELQGVDIDMLGLKLKLSSAEDLRKLLSPTVMDLADVDVLVVGIDRRSSVLRESVVLARFAAVDLQDEIKINESGTEPPHRLLSNRFSGFQIELAFVQNKDIQGNNPTKPRTKGALIARASWEVKPVFSDDVIQPEELTEESRVALGLTKDSWMYFEAKPELITATSFEDAIGFHVDKALLGQFQLLTSESRVLAETLIYSNAVTQLIYETSISLRAEESSPEKLDPDIEGADDFSDSQVMRLMAIKFPKRDYESIREYIKENPAKVVAEFLGDPRMLKKIMKAVIGLNGGSNELSDFEDE